MNLNPDQKRFIREGLNCLIERKEFEIKQIKRRTPDDYRAEILIAEKFSHAPFDLEKSIEQDIQKVNIEIAEIRKIYEEYNSLENHVLIVPSFIQLQLSTIHK